jgi:uncharacterized membrane protein
LKRRSIDGMFEFPLHRFIVHFPIALALFAVIYDAWAVYARRDEMHDMGYNLSLWAGFFALLAVVTGLQIASLSEIGKSAVTGHALFGITAAIVLAAFAVIRYSARARRSTEHEAYSKGWLVVEILAGCLVLLTAFLGHQL